MKRTVKRSILSILMAVVVFGVNVIGCANKGNVEVNVPAKIWTATGIEKILKDRDYSTCYCNNTLNISAFRNECESGQILITPEKNAKYTIELSSLRSNEGNLLSGSCFTVYHQKYIEVTSVNEDYFTYGTGFYPDALLPYATAVEYGENTVTANKNQGIWITVKPDKNQQAGVYKGTFKVKVGKSIYDVPVVVTVFDYTLSDENHQKTRFTVSDYDLAISELDGTREMHEAYTEYFLDYRISTTLAYEATYSNDISGYVNEAVKLAKDVRCNSISLPYKQTTTTVEHTSENKIAVGDERGCEGNTKIELRTVDWSLLEKMYFSVAEACFKENVNIFEKIDCFFTFLDEYDQYEGEIYRNNLNTTIYNLRRQVDFVENFAKIIESANLQNGNVTFSSVLSFDDENSDAGVGYSLSEKQSSFSGCTLSSSEFNKLKDEMKSSCEKIRTVITAAGINDEYAEYTDSSFCPGPKYYYRYGEGLPYKAFDYSKDSYAEAWCYTCAGPNNGYPSYHIDDNLISARMLSWEMYENDIVGNLFWECVLSRNVDLTDQNLSSQLTSQDYYSDAERFPGTNGDGFLVYPGRQYGIKGPVGSIRLQAIRDGIEDYELLYALEEKYAERSADGAKFDTVYKFITEKLTRRGVCNYESDYVENFLSCRQMLADLLVAAENTDTLIESCCLNGNNAVITVTSNVSTKITYNGNVLNGTQKENYVEYIFTLNLSQSITDFAIVAEKNGTVCEIKFPIGSANSMSVSEILEKSKVTTNTLSGNGKSMTIDGEEVASFNCNAKGKKQSVIEIDVSDFKFDYYSNKIILNVYYGGSEPVEALLSTQCGSGKPFYAFDRKTVKQSGWIEFEITADAHSMANGMLMTLRLTFTANDGNFDDSFDFYIKGVSAYGWSK